MDNKITMVITSSNRYELLYKTIYSFLEYNTYPIEKYIIIDDSAMVRFHKQIKREFGYMFEIICNTQRIGQIASIDKAYSMVKTDYIFHCFKAGTYIETISGAKLIKNIQIGDLVKTHTGDFKPVINTFKHHLKKNRPLLWLNTPNSLLKVTPEHPFYIYRDSIPQWIMAKDILKTDYFMYPIKAQNDVLQFNCKDRWNKWDTLSVTEDFAKFMGFYLAEGYPGHDSIRFSFNNNEVDFHSFIINFCINTFKRKPTVHIRWATTIKLNIRSFSYLFSKWFGTKANNKRIPKFVFEWSLKNKLNFIYGYILGDGYLKSGGSAVVVSASLDLINDFELLCNSCGISVGAVDYRKETTSVYHGRPINGSKCYAVRLNKNCWNKLKDILFAKVHNNYCLIPVINIQHKKQNFTKDLTDSFVYNLEVQDHNSYIANSVIAHNCEDDWQFYRHGFIEPSLQLLSYYPKFLQVWLREMNDTNGHPVEPQQYLHNGIAYRIMSYGYKGYSGFSFNPGLRRLSDYKLAAPYAATPYNSGEPGKGTKYYCPESEISQIYEKLGYKAVILEKGFVRHIGQHHRVGWD